MERNIDASGLILGRLGTVVAKYALLGDTVQIYNVDKVVLTGKKEMILDKYKHMHERGYVFKGPFIPRMPDRFVRRAIRGMLPYKTPKGRSAFARVQCFMGPAKEGTKTETIQNADVTKVKKTSYLTVGELCTLLGGKR